MVVDAPATTSRLTGVPLMVLPRRTGLTVVVTADSPETDPVWPEPVMRVAKRFAATINTRPEAWDFAVLLIALIPTATGQRQAIPRVWASLPPSGEGTPERSDGRRWVQLPADDHVHDEEMHRGAEAILSTHAVGREEPPLIWWITARRDPVLVHAASIPTEMTVHLSTVPGLTLTHLDDPSLLDGLA